MLSKPRPNAIYNRRIFGLSVILVLAVLSGCGGERFDSVRNLGSAGETIVCFGDSLTEGVGAGSGEDYPTVLSRELMMPVVNAGRRGDTTARALERISASVMPAALPTGAHVWKNPEAGEWFQPGRRGAAGGGEAGGGDTAEHRGDGIERREQVFRDEVPGVPIVAGPEPQDGKPVGTVFVAVAGPSGSAVRQLSLTGSRADIRSASVMSALSLLAAQLAAPAPGIPA